MSFYSVTLCHGILVQCTVGQSPPPHSPAASALYAKPPESNRFNAQCVFVKITCRVQASVQDTICPILQFTYHAFKGNPLCPDRLTSSCILANFHNVRRLCKLTVVVVVTYFSSVFIHNQNFSNTKARMFEPESDLKCVWTMWTIHGTILATKTMDGCLWACTTWCHHKEEVEALCKCSVILAGYTLPIPNTANPKIDFHLSEWQGFLFILKTQVIQKRY